MQKVDFHGMSKSELEQKLDSVIGMVRVCGLSLVYEFITGEGPLKEHLKKYLKEQYDLEYTENHNSSGTLFVTVE